jgi:hypothetical protein
MEQKPGAKKPAAKPVKGAAEVPATPVRTRL